MKEFKDLVFFKKWSDESLERMRDSGLSDFAEECATSKRASMKFDNGYEISVITGYGAYGDIEKPYEVAIIYHGDLVQAGIIKGDTVQGYMDELEVTEFMIKVQELL